MIAVVVPTIRPEQYSKFRKAWLPLFDKHGCDTDCVQDGDTPTVLVANYHKTEYPAAHPWRQFCYNYNDGVRNLGFLKALEDHGKELEIIITLDDDVIPEPGTDPIEDHIYALTSKTCPTSWFSTADLYMRGFPYGVREESEVWVSHGVWNGVHDYDGPTQLVNGNLQADFYRGPIPKGALFPCCGMSLAFKVEALPWMYFAPMGKALGVQRFADIWMGIHMKRSLDALNKAVVTGYSTVRHERASNVFANLEQEAVGIKVNEEWWQQSDPWSYRAPFGDGTYFQIYKRNLDAWQTEVRRLMER